MSGTENDGFELYDEPTLGVQDDGEPAGVTEEEEPKKAPAAEEEEAEEAETTEEEGEEEEKPKKKSGSQRAREKAERLEIEIRLLREQLAGKKPAGDEPKVQKEGAPNPDDFENHDDYLVAKAKHEIRQEDADKAQKDRAAAARVSWDKKVEAGREKFEDFDDALKGAESPSALLAPRLVADKTPVEVVYHLATHPKELRAINALTDPDDVADAMAELKARVLAPKDPPKKPTTKAPAPLTPVKGSAAASQSDDGFEVY